jgi:hypothetical protein
MRNVTTPSGARAHSLRVRHWERAVPPCRSTQPAAKRSHITVRATFHLRMKAFCVVVWVPVEPSSSRNCPGQSELARAPSRKSFVDGAIEGVDQRSDMPPRQLGSGCALPHALQGRMGHLFALWAGLGRFHRIRRISRFAFEGNRSGCGPSVRACLHNRRTCALDARSSLRFCGSCCRIRCILAFEPNFDGSCFGCGPSVRECLRNWCTCA